jgi:hypothetical protein
LPARVRAHRDVSRPHLSRVKQTSHRRVRRCLLLLTAEMMQLASARANVLKPYLRACSVDNPIQSKPSPRSITTVQWEAVRAITDSVGRRGVRIYGLSREQLGAAVITLIFVGIPSFVFLSMMPAWDYVGDFWWVSRINEYIAPAINSLDISYRAEGFPRFPVKRFVVAAEVITALLFCINFASLFLRKIRKHALLVWVCFDHKKIFIFLFVSGLIFAIEWYVLFYDWSILRLLESSGRQGLKVEMIVVLYLPSVALLFGHLTAIAILGVSRSALRALRPHWKYSAAEPISHVVREPKRKTAGQVTIIQLIGLAVIGIALVAALRIFVSSVHSRLLTFTKTWPSSGAGSSSSPASQSSNVLSDYGPKRAGCDGKWLHQPDSSYEDFLRKCMRGP